MRNGIRDDAGGELLNNLRTSKKVHFLSIFVLPDVKLQTVDAPSFQQKGKFHEVFIKVQAFIEVRSHFPRVIIVNFQAFLISINRTIIS